MIKVQYQPDSQLVDRGGLGDQRAEQAGDTDLQASPMERFEATWARVIESFAAHRQLWVATIEATAQAEHAPEVRAFLADALQQGREGLAALFQNIDAAVDEKQAWTVGSFYQALFDGRLGDLLPVGPQHTFFLQYTRGFTHRAQMPPDQGEHKGHLDRQGQDPFTQPHGMEGRDLREGCGMNQLGQPRFNLFVGWCAIRALGAIALDGARMPHAAFLGFGFLADTSSLRTPARSANRI